MIPCACGCGTMIDPVGAGGRPKRFVFHHHPDISGDKHPGWKGGVQMSGGYRRVIVAGHNPCGAAKRKPEHVLIVERVLGKPLPIGAEVHHFDEVKTNNENSNLVPCENRAYHILLHIRKRMLDHGANPDTEKWCPACNTVKLKEFFHAMKKKVDGRATRCTDCMNRPRRKAFVALLESGWRVK